MAPKEEKALLTIAAVRQGADGKTQYLFNERARIFTLTPQTRTALASVPSPAADAVSAQPVQVTLDLERGTILQIAPPSTEARAAVAVAAPPLEKPERVVPLNLRTIDPTLFDYVDIAQKWPVFSL